MGDVEVDVRSENGNHCYEPTPDDLDMMYDGDEKSSRSERSSRSSRSERSHSDENCSFMGEDTDLTVKATVSESLGIKLTITKRPKLKSTSDGGDKQLGTKKAGAVPVDGRRRRRKDSASFTKLRKEPLVLAAFERVEMRKKPSAVFVFWFQGREQKSNSLELRRKSLPLASPQQPVAPNICHQLSLQMKLFGPLPTGTTGKTSRRKLLALHHCTAGVDSILWYGHVYRNCPCSGWYSSLCENRPYSSL